MKAHITFEVEVSDIAGLLSRLGMADAPVTIEHGNSDTATRSRRSRTTQTEANDAPAQETPASETAPRRRRGAAETETPAAEPVANAAASEGSSRRRRTPSSSADVPAAPVISDIDLGKAASEAAESLTKLGDAGHQIVQDVLKEDFGVEMVNDLPADKRQAFLDELLNQVALAKADAAKQ